MYLCTHACVCVPGDVPLSFAQVCLCARWRAWCARDFAGRRARAHTHAHICVSGAHARLCCGSACVERVRACLHVWCARVCIISGSCTARICPASALNPALSFPIYGIRATSAVTLLRVPTETGGGGGLHGAWETGGQGGRFKTRRGGRRRPGGDIGGSVILGFVGKKKERKKRKKNVYPLAENSS